MTVPPRDDATVAAFSSPSQRSKDVLRHGGSHAPPPRPDPNAKTFGPDGRYQVVEQLGRGGFGTVYRAYDHRLAKYVAIKAINVSDIPGNEIQTYIRLFDSEAKIAAQLDHPGIVTVLDYDPYAGNPYIVMSLVEGGTLHDWFLAHPRMAWQEVADLGVQVAEALHYAHMHGVQAHRDIKPGNIFRAAERYKVGDFGIARRIAVGSGITRSTFFSAGTPRYMAPEQILTPRSVDARTDLFSLAAVLYEALTGRSAFRGVTLDFDPEEDPTSARRIIDAAFRPPTPIRKLAPDVPPEMARAIERGLEGDPAARFRDCAAFAKALQGEAPSRRTAPKRQRLRVRNRRVAAALLVLLAVAGYASWPWVEANVPLLRRMVRGGDDLTLARRAAQEASAAGFAMATWNEAEAHARQAEELHSDVYRKDAVRLYWLAAVRSSLELIARTEVLAERSLAKHYAPAAYTRASTAWEKQKVRAYRLERQLVDGERSAVDDAGNLVPALRTIVANYQQAALDASRRARAALTKKLDDVERRLDEIRSSADPGRLRATEALAAEARSAVQAGDLPTSQKAVQKVEQAVASLAVESLTIARARADKARWEVAALRIERRNVQPELAAAWEQAEKKYEEGKIQLEAANNTPDIAAAEAALKTFGAAKEMLTRLNKAVRKSQR
jgi:hypothetical protein